MLALKWIDKWQVNMRSIIHDDSPVMKRRKIWSLSGRHEDIEKPTVMEQYNMHMVGWTRPTR